MPRPELDLPFSQRDGVLPIPEQLKLGQVSRQLILRLNYALSEEVDRNKHAGHFGSWFDERWLPVAKDLHVIFFERSISSFKNEPFELKTEIDKFLSNEKYYRVFDLIEFFLGHDDVTEKLKKQLSSAFVTTRAAYRVFDHRIVAVGADEQAAAFVLAVKRTEAADAIAARSHLLEAGKLLAKGDWASSIRESVHSVESIALKIDGDAATLGPALDALAKKGHIHGALKSAFGSLYGYSSDEQGVRHAKVFEEVANVDEADALFMLGACSSFVTYLIGKTAK